MATNSLQCLKAIPKVRCVLQWKNGCKNATV